MSTYIILFIEKRIFLFSLSKKLFSTVPVSDLSIFSAMQIKKILLLLLPILCVPLVVHAIDYDAEDTVLFT